MWFQENKYQTLVIQYVTSIFPAFGTGSYHVLHTFIIVNYFSEGTDIFRPLLSSLWQTFISTFLLIYMGHSYEKKLF